jgi:hypothetical protein
MVPLRPLPELSVPVGTVDVATLVDAAASSDAPGPEADAAPKPNPARPSTTAVTAPVMTQRFARNAMEGSLPPGV